MGSGYLQERPELVANILGMGQSLSVMVGPLLLHERTYILHSFS
jgi:hypothetical protein